LFAETETAKHILSKKAYYLPEETEPDQMLRRVAGYIASAFGDDEERRDYWNSMFYTVMKHARFLPNSPCLVNAGRESGGLFACFVLGMEDNLDSITDAKSDAMAITKAGGGWGIGLSSLRPFGSRVSGSTHGIAGGPVGFWETFSGDMRTMTQGGFRDAACMATMMIDHPDILRFIRAKTPENSIRRLLNLDLIVDNKDDIPAIVNGLLKNSTIASAAETYMSNFNISVLATDRFMKLATSDSYDHRMPTGFGGVEHESFSPKSMLDEIAHGMWVNGEPGILFIDTIRDRTRYEPEEIMATNPCGEQPLPPNGSCCLGSINLAGHIRNGKFDNEMFRETVRIAVRFLNNMITLNKFPTDKTREWSLYHRSIGLGVMGFADALILMGVSYDSEAAKDFARFVGEVMLEEATSESKEIFKEGYSRPVDPNGAEGSWDGRNNHALLSIAPTGTISLLAGCSPGVEPVFSEKILRVDSTGSHIMNHPLADRDAFVTLKDLHYIYVIDIVAAFSEYVDSSISYTVNLSNDATINDVKHAVYYAWQAGCNGITIYRDGSRNRQVLNASEEDQIDPLERPSVLDGKTYKYTGNIDGEKTNLYVTLNSKDGNPYEVFVHTPHIESMTELQLVTVVTRLSSLCMRYGIPTSEIVEQLRKAEGQSVTSVPAIITRALAEYEGVSVGDCPECGSKMMYTGGCNVCPSCGHSSCG